MHLTGCRLITFLKSRLYSATPLTCLFRDPTCFTRVQAFTPLSLGSNGINLATQNVGPRKQKSQTDTLVLLSTSCGSDRDDSISRHLQSLCRFLFVPKRVYTITVVSIFPYTWILDEQSRQFHIIEKLRLYSLKLEFFLDIPIREFFFGEGDTLSRNK